MYGLLCFFPSMKQEKDNPTEDQKQKDLDWLANRLRTLRKAKGYTNYEYFAYENGIPRAQYGRYENGQDIRYSTLMKIIRAFDMTAEEFFGNEKAKN